MFAKEGRPVATPMLLTLDEAQRILRIGRTKMWQLTRPGGEIETVRIGRSVRVPWTALSDFLERQRTGGGA